jgi:hypothetical protein
MATGKEQIVSEQWGQYAGDPKGGGSNTTRNIVIGVVAVFVVIGVTVAFIVSNGPSVSLTVPAASSGSTSAAQSSSAGATDGSSADAASDISVSQSCQNWSAQKSSVASLSVDGAVASADVADQDYILFGELMENSSGPVYTELQQLVLDYSDIQTYLYDNPSIVGSTNPPAQYTALTQAARTEFTALAKTCGLSQPDFSALGI